MEINEESTKRENQQEGSTNWAQTASQVVLSTVTAVNPSRMLPGRPMKEIDGWQIVRMLGRGGMGAVYLAKKPQGIVSSEILHRTVALKTFNERLDRKRIAKEIKAQSDFNHPNLVHYLGHGTYKGVLYLLMNYVEGTDAWRMAHPPGNNQHAAQPFPLHDACAITVEVAKGLSHIHRKAGFVHRDVKPANILISDEGSVILGDLGLADISGGQDGGGTPGFVAPEQAHGQETDARADIYSLGCTLFFMLTGTVPFEGISFADPGGLMKAHMNPDLKAQGLEAYLPDAPKALCACLADMLAKDRAPRPSSRAVIDTLRPFIGEADIQRLFNGRRGGPETIPESENSLELSKDQLPLARMDRRSVLLGLSAVSTVIGIPLVLGRLGGEKVFEQLDSNAVQVPGNYRLLNLQPEVLTRNKGRWAEPEFEPNQLVMHAGDFCMVQLGQLDMAHTPNFRLVFDLDIRGSWNGSVGVFFGCQAQGDKLTYHKIDISDNAHPIIKPAFVYNVLESDLDKLDDTVLSRLNDQRNLTLPNFNFTRQFVVEARQATVRRVAVMPTLEINLEDKPEVTVPRDLSGAFGVFIKGQVNAVITNAAIQFLE